MTKLLRLYAAGTLRASSWTAALLLTALAAGLMFYSAWQESAIMDELAHIPSGYAYVHELDYRLNPEHPPLVKALSAAPLLLMSPTFPTDNIAWTEAINGQWDMGTSFLYGAGNDGEKIVRVSRILPIILTLLLILTVYAWSKERLGRFWALLPVFLTALSPTILAHGHYVTTDIGATLGIFLASWRFVVLLESPSRKNLWLAGLSFGVAELLKFSAVLLIPYFVMLAGAHWLARCRNSTRQKLLALFFVFLIGYMVVVYPVYALFTAKYPIARQVADSTAILTSFGGGPKADGCGGIRCVADLTIAAAGNPITRPLAEYALGVLMVMQRADGGNTAYFLGQVSAAGSRLYFPVVYLLKESLPALILLAIALIATLAGALRALRAKEMRLRLRTYFNVSFPEFAMFLFVLFYWAYSMKSPLNIGVRHILPTIPFIYILIASAWKRWVMKFSFGESNRPLDVVKAAAGAISRMTLKSAFLALLLLWLGLETAVAAPNFLSYFNQFGGGTAGGYRYVVDSNYDWGQDLQALEALLAKHPEIDRIALDYFGGGSAALHLKDRAVPWSSSKGDPREQGIHWFAVSINNLQNSIQPPVAGFERQAKDQYPWLLEGRTKEARMGGVPEADLRAGTSIFIYRLP